MQKKLLFLVQLVLCAVLFSPVRVMAQDADIVLQPQFGKQTVTLETGQVITFYDPKGTDAIPSANSSNAQSLVVFKPAQEGMSIQVTFEQFDVIGSNNSYPAFVNVYNGEADADNSFAYATSVSDVNYNNLKLPEGDLLGEKLTGNLNVPFSYYSTTQDGALSVGYLYRYAERCEGWVAKVSCVKLENMQTTAASSAFDLVPQAPVRKTDVALASVCVNTTGMLNADHLTTISYRLTKNEGAIDPAQLRLYRGYVAYATGLTPLSANITESDGVYTFVLDEPMESGDNWFTLAADLLPSAQIGAQVQLEVTAVATKGKPDGVTPFTAGEGRAVASPAIVCISDTHQNVSVGDTPLAFYDDGGLDGQVTKGFNGSITFLPTSDGKKVMIDFTKVAIFYGTMYSQYLKVYNGQEATADNLLRELLTGDVLKVRSTSPDGALTVVFESTTDGYTGDGFEALVSQFVPQPMQVAGITATQSVQGTLCAGETQCPVLCFNIQTSDTEPALSVQSLSFNTLGTFPQLSRASVFFTRDSNAFSDKVKVGEAQVSEDNFVITAQDIITFREGDNYLWLTYDIADLATSGQKVDAAISSVTLSDGEHTVEQGSPDGEFLIRNIVLSHRDQGTVTTRVNGSMEFAQKAKNDYSTDYEDGTDDRINIFEPLHEGMVCQIDFSAFKLYWASYGTDHSTLKVYSGKGTTGELLWELTSKDDKDKGPEQTLRSTSPDGAITVLFNSGVSQSWYTTSGFKAVVSEYQSRDMVIDTLTTVLTGKTMASVGAQKQEALTLQVAASGNLNAKSLLAANVLLKGNVQDVTRVSLYAVDAPDSAIPADAEPLATQEVTLPQDEQSEAVSSLPLTLILDTPCVLQEGVNNFRLVLDISQNALSGDVVELMAQSVSATDVQVEVAAGAPVARLDIKNILNLQSGDNGEVLVASGQPLLFYDDGGVDGQYSSNFQGTVTFAPKTPGQSVRLGFKTFSVTAKDYLRLYHGGEVKETADASYSMYDHPDYFVSESEDGKVTVSFTTQYSKDGFAIEVTAYQKQPLHVASVTTQSIAPESVMRGEEHVSMVRVDVQVDGDLDQLDITRFNVQDADAAQMRSVQVFTTDTLGVYAPLNLFGEATEGRTAIDGTYRVTKPGVYKFWLACNVNPDTQAGDMLNLSITSLVANDSEAIADAPVVACTTVQNGINGIITVGAGADYGTIQAAVNALQDGIDGPVTINIKRGIYNELVNVPAIKGASSTNTVTIQSETGNWHDVKVYYDTYNEPAYSDDKMAAEFGVFTFAGADWITLRGVEVTSQDLTFPGVLHVKNVSQHVTIDSCYVHAPKSTSYSSDINLIYTYAKSEAYCNNDYLTVTRCLLEGGYIGVRMGGTGTVKLPKECGGRIEDNILKDQGSKAIYCMDEVGAQIRRNRILNSGEAASCFYGFDGQLRDVVDEQFAIEGNTFNLATSNDAIAINLRQATATATAPALVANNEISVAPGGSSSAGIKVNNLSSNLFIAYNTVLMNGTKPSVAVYINNEQGEGVQVVNNILQVRDQGYVYRCYNQAVAPTLHFSHNILHTSGEVFAYDKSQYATYADWQAVSAESDSYCEVVDFLSDEILEPVLGDNMLHALPLPAVTTDLYGKQRDAEHPTVGAYEYDADESAPQLFEGYPCIANITNETADLVLKADKSAILFVQVRKASEAAPTADEMMESTLMQMARQGDLISVTLNGLTVNEEYVAYALLMGLRGTNSEVFASDKFVAGGEVIVEIPNVAAQAEASESVEPGQKATFTVYVTEGTAPFSIVWTNGKHILVASSTLDALGESVLEYAPQECDLYYLTVTDANGKEARDTCRVAVTGDAVAATFENLFLEQDGFWWGPDTKGHMGQNSWGLDEIQGSFVSGSYAFENRCMQEYSTWGGFAYSRRTGTNFDVLMTDQFNSSVGSGYQSSDNYAVGYEQGTISVLNSPVEGDSIRGCYVTNNAYALQAILNGYSMARKFVQDDYLKVTFTGHHADGTQSTVDYYLADYRQASEADHYALDTWQWVDLRPLGRVTSVTYSISGSDAGAYGLNTPAYFCLDNFNGEREVSVAPVQTDGDEVDLTALFQFDDATATVIYSLADELPAQLEPYVAVSADGKLTLTDIPVEQFAVTVKAVQKGKIQFLTIPYDIPTAISEADAGRAHATATRYNVTGQQLDHSQRGVNILRSQDGSTRKVLVK